MQTTQKNMKIMSCHGFSQFELTTNLLRNLYKFDITPVTKLVLLELTTHLNDKENGAVVFPSVEFIAKKLGIGLTATKKAIKDLISEGLIIKSKRSKVRGNYNKYLLTLKVQNLTAERPENDFLKQSDSDCSMITNKKNKEKTNVVQLKPQYENNFDKEILETYARKNGAKNIKAYVNALYIRGVTAEIIKQNKEIEKVETYWEKQAVKTTEIVENYSNMQGDEPSESFKALKQKLRVLCNK